MKIENVMFGFVLVFLSSALWPNLPTISLIALLFFILVFALALPSLIKKHQHASSISAVIAGMVIGFFWASFCIYYYTIFQIPAHYYSKNILIEGEVISLIKLTPLKQGAYNRQNALKFNVKISKMGDTTLPSSAIARLSWYSPKLRLRQGQTVKLLVSLKRPVGLANPDGFNYQKWLVSKNIAALGHVRISPSNQVLDESVSLRQKLVNELLTLDITHLKWLLALSYGDRRLLESEDWAFLQRTGTAHLFAISGMHLGIVFGFMLILFKFSFLASIMLRNTVNRHIPQFNFLSLMMVLALVAATFYAFLAGYEVPVMRALITLFFWTILLVFKRHWRLSSVLLALLTTFFIVFPFSILSISFWFSFGAVAIIILFTWRFPPKQSGSFFQHVVYAIRLQLFLSLATLPIIAVVFNTLPLNSFLANLIMIPVVTFLLVPLCLLASAFQMIAGPYMPLYRLIDIIFELSFGLLKVIDRASEIIINKDFHSSLINVFSHPLMWLAIFLTMLPAWPQKKRTLGACFIVYFSFMFTSKQQTFKYEWSLYAMDVGQGSALILELPKREATARDTKQNKHYIVYDTGNAGLGFSMANTVLLPFFRANKVEDVSLLVVSHLDQDHNGGTALIQDTFNVKHTITPSNACNVYSQSQNPDLKLAPISDISITILWPLSPMSGHKNDESCVLKVSDQFNSVLFTGDIEKETESILLNLYSHSDALNADVIIAPHHGSNSSSSLPFLEAVNPRYVIFTSGYNNRWGFPHADVVSRYKALNINMFNTGKDGRIKLTFSASDPYISRYRQDEFKRWYFSAP